MFGKEFKNSNRLKIEVIGLGWNHSSGFSLHFILLTPVSPIGASIKLYSSKTRELIGYRQWGIQYGSFQTSPFVEFYIHGATIDIDLI